jgi:hypothetical protein
MCFREEGTRIEVGTYRRTVVVMHWFARCAAALLPYIVPFIFANVGGMVADWIIALPQRHTWATVAFARKLCQGIDFIGTRGFSSRSTSLQFSLWLG